MNRSAAAISARAAALSRQQAGGLSAIHANVLRQAASSDASLRSGNSGTTSGRPLTRPARRGLRPWPG